MAIKSEETRHGIRIRKHYATSTKISEDGLFVEKEFIDHEDGNKLKTYNPKIKVDGRGLRYIENKKAGKVYIQDLVADCFCAPKPNDGNYYVLVHKDGNLQNDHYRNLEWRLATSAYPQTTAKTADKVKLTDGLEISKDGKVYQDGKELSVGNSISDPDLDMVVPVEPYVEYERRNERWKRTERKRIKVDDLMDIAGYVDWNKNRFKDPVILHKDNDWLNFDSGNLEWTDRNDPRYEKYKNGKASAKDTLGRELNGEEKWKYKVKQGLSGTSKVP